MHIGVIGAGNVGGTLARRFAACGHQVSIGARDATKARREFADVAVTVCAPDALQSCAAIVLATPWNVTVDAVTSARLTPGQIVIDCTNPIAGRLAGLDPAGDDSGAEAVQRAIPQARVIKAFNTCGYEVMAAPTFASGRACMPVCGDDADARGVVIELARALGFEVLDLGPLRHARYLEPMAMVWILRAIALGAGRRWAFSVVT